VIGVVGDVKEYGHEAPEDEMYLAERAEPAPGVFCSEPTGRMSCHLVAPRGNGKWITDRNTGGGNARAARHDATTIAAVMTNRLGIFASTRAG